MQKTFSKKITLLKFIKDKSSLLIQNTQIMENLPNFLKKIILLTLVLLSTCM